MNAFRMRLAIAAWLVIHLTVLAQEPTPEIGPLGQQGLAAHYQIERVAPLPASVVKSFALRLGPVEKQGNRKLQWLEFDAVKANGGRFQVWLLCDRFLPERLNDAQAALARYLLREGDQEPVEFRDQRSGQAVLPMLGAWPYLLPRSLDGTVRMDPPPQKVNLLGHLFTLASTEVAGVAQPPDKMLVLNLFSEVLLGVPHNTKQADETRRYDGSDYPLVRLTQKDYEAMIAAGMNCFNADPEQRRWLEQRGVYYWGGELVDLPYPEFLYRANYLGPALFLDEPAVTTRDYIIRPRLKQDPNYAHNLTPQIVLEAFQEQFKKAKNEGGPAELMRGLAARTDVDVGNMKFLQENLFTWETMISTAIHQLRDGGAPPPSAIVFEPPGHLGTRRTLPEMDMAYECQIPTTDPSNLSGLIYGFLRGAARLSGRDWGTSIYGAVDPADSPGLLTQAYDQGARLFVFWDTAELACVPFGECLALARHLRAHIQSYPPRDLPRLKTAAEVLILLPPGYNLGHVHMGKGSLWGLPELNLERTNRWGVTYRTVMHNVFTEVERCIRLGIAYDIVWDVPHLDVAGYREVVQVREDGKIEVQGTSGQALYDQARTPPRPDGAAPRLIVDVESSSHVTPATVTAHAEVIEGAGPVFYTARRNPRGVYENAVVLWELFGPREEDYRYLLGERLPLLVESRGSIYQISIRFTVSRPGRYRLRAATVDEAGRTVVVWKNLEFD